MSLLNPVRRPRSHGSTARRRISPFGPLEAVASKLGALEALATPHGVDRYLELVHPMLTVRELRAVVTDVQRTTRRQRHPDPSAHPAVDGLPSRPVRTDRHRHRRRPAHAFLFAVVLAVPRGRPDRDHRQGPSRGTGLAVPAREREAGPRARALAGQRRLPVAGRAARAAGPDQRRQRHHARAVDAAHPARRELHRRHRVPALRVHREGRRPPGRAAHASPPGTRTSASSSPTRSRPRAATCTACSTRPTSPMQRRGTPVTPRPISAGRPG